MLFLKKNAQTILLVLLILAASVLRLWQIRDYQIFLGDEGRDMIVMRKMIQEKRPTFLGPTASVGGFYLGPMYYWMATPFLLLSKFDPVGPSTMVALFGIGTVVLLYKFLKDAVGFWPALLASSLYATAPLVVRYSRSSWNPNPLPFFALTMLYSVYLGISKNKNIFFIIAGAAFGIAIQLHYLSVMLLPITAAIVAINTKYKKWPLIVGLCALGAFITFSPFLLFELKHNFPNFHTILEFVTRDSTHGYRANNYIWIISNFGNVLLEDLSNLKMTPITKYSYWVLVLGSLYALVRAWKDKPKRLVYSIGAIYFIGGLFLLRYYSGQIFDYYFGFMFPAPFIVIGLLYALFWDKIYVKVFCVILTAVMVGYFLNNEFYKTPPNRLIDQTENVAEFVIEKSENKPFNFALITNSNSDHGYRYFLDIKGHKPTELETMITDQLLVVCESKECAPLGYPSWEIAGFGRAEVIDQWKLPDIGITVIKLQHWPGAPNPAGKPAVKGQ